MDSNIQVRLPAEAQVMEYVESIGLKYSLLGEERVFVAMDGLKLYVEQSGSHTIEYAFYNCWKHDHYVSNIFLFTPDSKRVAAECSSNISQATLKVGNVWFSGIVP
eukprot:32025-Ditylum_brightwellii.AAC.1